MDWATLIIALTGLVGVILTYLNQRKINRLEAIRVNDRSQIRHAELDNLEHKMVLELAAKYQDLIKPLEAEVSILRERLIEYKESLEEKETANNQLQQTVQLQERKISHLENKVMVLEKKLVDLENGQK